MKLYGISSDFFVLIRDAMMGVVGNQPNEQYFTNIYQCNFSYIQNYIHDYYKQHFGKSSNESL